jgi:hypothetical protein
LQQPLKAKFAQKSAGTYFFWNLELFTLPGVINDPPNDFRESEPEACVPPNRQRFAVPTPPSVTANHCSIETNFYQPGGVDFCAIGVVMLWEPSGRGPILRGGDQKAWTTFAAMQAALLPSSSVTFVSAPSRTSPS